MRAQVEGTAEEIGADELLPLFIFVLVRARVPSLYSQARFISDFLPKHYTLGRHGYSLFTLQVLALRLHPASFLVTSQCTQSEHRRPPIEHSTVSLAP